MAVPVIRSKSKSAQTTAGTSHAVLLPPTVSAGDLLLVILHFKANGYMPSLAGWTVGGPSGTSDGYSYVSWKIATGSEGGTTVYFDGGNTISAHLSYAISGVSLSGVQYSADSATGSSSSPDPAAGSRAGSGPPYGMFNTVSLAISGNRNAGGAPATVSAFPTNWTTDSQQQAAGSAAGDPNLAAGCRTVEQDYADPGVFTLDASNTWYAFTIYLTPTVPTTTYAWVRSAGEGAAGDATGYHTVTLPTDIEAGDTILCFLACDAGEITGLHADWTGGSGTNGTAMSAAWGWRKATGASQEGTTVSFAATSDNAEPAYYTVYCIAGATDPTVTAPTFGTASVATTSAPDPPSVSPGSSKKYAIFAFEGNDHNDLLTGYPSGYMSGRMDMRGEASGDAGVASALGFAETDTCNPGAFALDGSDETIAQTCAVHPAATGDTTVTLTASSLTLTGSQVTRSGDANRAPATGVFDLTAPQVTAGVDVTATLTASQLALTAPQVGWTADALRVLATAGQLVLSGPQVSPVAVTNVVLTAGVLTVEKSQPTISGNATAAPAEAGLFVTAPQVTRGAGVAVALTAAQMDLVAPQATPNLGTNATVSLTAAALELTAPQVGRAGNAARTLTVGILTLAASQASGAGNANAQPAAGELSLTAPQALTSIGAGVVLVAGAFTLTAPQVGWVGDATTAPAVGVLVLTAPQTTALWTQDFTIPVSDDAYATSTLALVVDGVFIGVWG